MRGARERPVWFSGRSLLWNIPALLLASPRDFLQNFVHGEDAFNQNGAAATGTAR